MVPRHQEVVLVDFAIAAAPVPEFARGQSDPSQQLLVTDLRLLRPMPHEVDQLVSDVVGDPCRAQSSPRSFFKRMCSSINSESTSCLRCSRDSSASICFSNLVSLRAWPGPSKARAPFSKNVRCHW